MEQQNTDPGARLTELRKKRGMTQKSLGTALNISEQAVSKWERGTTMPDIVLLPAIAEILSTSIDYILTGKENVRYVTVSQYDMCRTDKRMGREKLRRGGHARGWRAALRPDTVGQVRPARPGLPDDRQPTDAV